MKIQSYLALILPLVFFSVFSCGKKVDEEKLKTDTSDASVSEQEELEKEKKATKNALAKLEKEIKKLKAALGEFEQKDVLDLKLEQIEKTIATLKEDDESLSLSLEELKIQKSQIDTHLKYARESEVLKKIYLEHALGYEGEAASIDLDILKQAEFTVASETLSDYDRLSIERIQLRVVRSLQEKAEALSNQYRPNFLQGMSLQDFILKLDFSLEDKGEKWEQTQSKIQENVKALAQMENDILSRAQLEQKIQSTLKAREDLEAKLNELEKNT